MSESTQQFKQLYEGLNEEQKKAVDTIEGPVMVLAGPGTGKTQTLAMRIAKILLETQMDPWNIVCLTFTESGVAAMRDRLVSIVGTPAYYVHIHTFHSFCNEIIQDHPELFARSHDWEPLADIERVELLESLVDQLPGTSEIKPFGSPYVYLKDITRNIQQLKQEDISPEKFERILTSLHGMTNAVREDMEQFFALKPKDRTVAKCEAIVNAVANAGKESGVYPSVLAIPQKIYDSFIDRHDSAEHEREAGKLRTAFKNDIKAWYTKLEKNIPKHKDVLKVYTRYQERLVKMGRYDYEDMIMMVVSALKEQDDLLAEYQERYQYILVDEYQDTNGAQNEVVQLLGSFDAQPNIFVVGDDKQSIYRFQGASLNNMLSFYTTYKEHVQVISLKMNYRSQQSILDASHAVIENNTESITKYVPGVSTTLVSASGEPRHIEELAFPSEDVERYILAKRVRSLIEDGVSPSDIAILFRRNADGMAMLPCLRRMDIPARLEAGDNVLDDVLVQQFIHLAEYIASGGRDEMLGRLLQYDWLRFDALSVVRIVRYASDKRIPLFDVISTPGALADAGIEDAKLFVEFAQLIADWKKLHRNTTVHDFLHHILADSGLMDYILQEHTSIDVLHKLVTLFGEIKTLNSGDHELSLSRCIEYISLYREHDVPIMTKPWQAADESVRLMTAHKAKGLEFDYVFIAHVNDKRWGNNREGARLSLPHGLVEFDFIAKGENNEDERRLFYVALTRAKKHVACTRSLYSASGKETVPSIFLREIPDELREEYAYVETDGQSKERMVHGELAPLFGKGHVDIRTWLEGVFQSYVMSVTHLNNYLECPRKFYVRNLLRMPDLPSVSQTLGVAVHGALDDFFYEIEKTGSVPPKSFLTSAFERHLDRQVLMERDRSDTREVGVSQLSGWYDKYTGQFAMHTLREYDFRSHGVRVGDVMLTGKIDKIEPVSDRVTTPWPKGTKVNVVDYKTGNPDKGLPKLRPGKDYHRQLVFYKLLCDESLRFPYEMESGEVDFIQPSDTKGFVKKKVVITDDEVRELKDVISQTWEAIRSYAFFDEGAGCGSCEHCT